MNGSERDLFLGVYCYFETGELTKDTFYVGAHGDWISDLAIALKNDTHVRFLVITENRGAF